MPGEFVRRIRREPVNSACMLLLVASALACAPRGSLGEDLADGTEDGAGSTTTGAPAGSESSDTTTDESTGATGTDGSTGPGGDSSSTAGDLCPPMVDDDACTTCTKSHCCEPQVACEADEVCTCIATCIADGGDPANCETVHCGGPSDAWIHLHDCVALNCAGTC